MSRVPEVLTVKVPFTVRKRGGRKQVLAPDGTAIDPGRPRIDSALVKALARAFRWKRMLDEGRYASVRELADGERVKPSYAAGVLRLTLLAPEIVEAIVDGRKTRGLTLDLLLKSFPLLWTEQSGISHGD